MTSPVALLGSPLRTLLAKLKSPKKSGSGYVAPCPAHEDDNPSLSVSEGRDGRVLLNCHAGCSSVAIMTALGMEMTALFAPRTPVLSFDKAHSVREERMTLLTAYDYTDADGHLLFQVCRYVQDGGAKTFRQRRPDGRGGWSYGLGDIKPVLYRLPEVAAAAESGRTIHIVEGEKDADALAGLGYIATTSPMGAGKWRDAYGEHIAGGEVVIFPDNDDPGRMHAEDVAASLTARKCLVKVVPLPGLPPKGDVSDWLESGKSLDEMEEVIGSTRIWTPDAADPTTRSRYRLDELWSNGAIMRAPPVVVPRIAWAGRLTLLAAREKAGKSTLTGFVTAQVSRGGRFLDGMCKSGPVLVIGLEEFIGDAARRLRHFDADPTRVHIVDRLHGDPLSRPLEIRTHIEAVEPALVIVDSLTAYSSGQIQDENSATQMTAVLKPLADLAHESGIAIVILHHANKSTGRARGSTGIMANADVVCEMTSTDEDADPTLRSMRTAGRVPVVPRWDFRFTGDTYTMADGIEAPVEDRIIATVTSRPMISINEVCDAVGGRRSDTQSAIVRMISNGVMVNEGDSRWAKLIVPAPKEIT